MKHKILSFKSKLVVISLEKLWWLSKYILKNLQIIFLEKFANYPQLDEVVKKSLIIYEFKYSTIFSNYFALTCKKMDV